MRRLAFWSVAFLIAAVAFFASDRRTPDVAAAHAQNGAAGFGSKPAPPPQLPVVGPAFAVVANSIAKASAAVPSSSVLAAPLCTSGPAIAPAQCPDSVSPPRTIPLRI